MENIPKKLIIKECIKVMKPLKTKSFTYYFTDTKVRKGNFTQLAPQIFVEDGAKLQFKPISLRAAAYTVFNQTFNCTLSMTYPLLITKDHIVSYFTPSYLHCAIPSDFKNSKSDICCLAHEFTHAEIYFRLRNRIPSWLNEGFATQNQASSFYENEMDTLRNKKECLKDLFPPKTGSYNVNYLLVKNFLKQNKTNFASFFSSNGDFLSKFFEFGGVEALNLTLNHFGYKIYDEDVKKYLLNKLGSRYRKYINPFIDDLEKQAKK